MDHACRFVHQPSVAIAGFLSQCEILFFIHPFFYKKRVIYNFILMEIKVCPKKVCQFEVPKKQKKVSRTSYGICLGLDGGF